MGLRKTLDRMNIDDKRIFAITVGLSDPDDEHNISNIENSMKEQLTEAVFSKLEIYHLRGGIDYARLSFIHHAMMKFLYSGAGKTRNPDDETREMINTYGKKVSLINFDSLNKIEL